ncbi:MAG: PDZ domain-containing protein [bacterium]|nr:PDZ domain-containing protein [bacterium]
MAKRVLTSVVLLGALLTCAVVSAEEAIPESLRASVDQAVARVKPALVRVEVVSTYYSEGREQKYESSGSGAIITKEGHVITNHHVAGHAARLVCTLSNKEEVEAELIGRDPLTDIAVIKLVPDPPRKFPVAEFGDSSKVRVGDTVLAMGSPMSLSQSVTLGIVSNAELVMPEWISRWGGLTQDGEDVGALVRWIGHDAQIFGGNSGGPLVNLDGQIIGVNEISIGLGGAIPGNLAKSVAETLMKDGAIKRAWLGVSVQPQLKHAAQRRGVLISSVLKDGPAAAAGMEAGDVLVKIAGSDVNVRFAEQMPEFNQLVADMPIGQPSEAVVLRDGKEVALQVTPNEREPLLPRESEMKQWGVTVRNISLLMAKSLKRDTTDGVLLTSLRPGGPADDAKPSVQRRDILIQANDTPITCVADMRAFTDQVTEGATEPVPVTVILERKSEQYLTVVEVGIKQLEDPGLEVKKAWLPVQTQVLTREIAEQLGQKGLTGFRITQVFKESTAEKAGLLVGDFILEVDGEKMTASAPEDYEQLPEWIRQYRIGDSVDILIERNGEQKTIAVELVRTPRLSREMKKYKNEQFEFTVRDITFFDKAEEKWKQEQRGVLVHEVKSGGWAALGGLNDGDLLVDVDGTAIADVGSLEKAMNAVEAAKPEAVVFKVLRGIHTAFLELEPKWDDASNNGKE